MHSESEATGAVAAPATTCIVCGTPYSFRWSDTHGVAACTTCGMPYRLYHYDENNQRVEKPPSPALQDSGVAIAKQYWSERKRRVFPACYDMGVSRSGQSYSGATAEDCEAFSAWYDEKYPPPAEAQAVAD